MRIQCATREALSRMLVVAAVVATCLLSSKPTVAQDDFAALLDAGEFGPARDFAAGVGDPAARDGLLSDIAAAQARVGALRASVDTASYIGDDRARSQSLSQIGGVPIGDRWGGLGGAPQADFDSLIELITTTIAPESWDEVGGPGAIDGFEAGVYVDAAGVMRKLPIDSASRSLASVRAKAASSTGNTNVRKESTLRKVSLTRLEKQVQLARAMGREPDEVMKSLAGIYKIKYVLVYPESGDIVIAGPAGDWHVDPEGRKINSATNQPVLHLDDFVVCLRNAYAENSRFGCSITPRQENLAATNKFLKESSKKPLAPGRLARQRWLDTVQEKLGVQDIEVYGIDPRTRAARVLVEADYRMKLVGMGLEDGVLGVTSYLDAVKLGPDGKPAPTKVLRWWFTLNYEGVSATKSHDAFELNGQGAKVLSENELLTELGERVHTGKSEEQNREFARSFTKHFNELAITYPIYAELRNVFDLALVSALMKAQDLPGQVDWHMTHFGVPKEGSQDYYEVELGAAPKTVDTVINHRLIASKHIVAGVSGGVSVNAKDLTQQSAIKTDTYGLMKADRMASAPKDLPRDAWWWD